MSLRYDLGDEHPLVGRSCPDFELADGALLKYVAGAAKDRLGLSAVVVRPDGFVTWVSDAAANAGDVKRSAARCSRFAVRERGHRPSARA